jgi:hypothetical protein
MNDKLGAIKAILYVISDAAAFLFATPLGLIILVAILIALAAARLWSAVSDRRLAVKAAGEDFGRAAALGAAARELASLLGKAAATLPTIAGVVLALVLVLGIADSSRKVDEYVAGQKRITELSTTLRNLERRYKAVEVRVDDVKDGHIAATLSFFDYKDLKAAPKTQAIDIAGKELFIDAIVCNFDYSSIASGSAINLAIPYRAFSDEVPEAEGVELSLFDTSGLPLMYRRSSDNVYGISSEAYEARLSELMADIRTDESARKEGIVRSLYGDAVHRVAKKGESFTVWVEQSGGLTIKDPAAF